MVNGFDELTEVLNNRYGNITESTYLVLGTVTGVNPLQVRNANGVIEVKRISYAVAEREKTRGQKVDRSLKVGDSVLLLVYNSVETFLIDKFARTK